MARVVFIKFAQQIVFVRGFIYCILFISFIYTGTMHNKTAVPELAMKVQQSEQIPIAVVHGPLSASGRQSSALRVCTANSVC